MAWLPLLALPGRGPLAAHPTALPRPALLAAATIPPLRDSGRLSLCHAMLPQCILPWYGMLGPAGRALLELVDEGFKTRA